MYLPRFRPDLKVVVTSATLDIRAFAAYFSAPMVRIPGKMFPVDVSYLPSFISPLDDRLSCQMMPVGNRVGP